jgi:drug/metabolite transporter superfamily protein YnfA
MFIAGLGNSWEAPLALMVLSVLGFLIGMLLRVRAYVYLGGSFLVLVISAMIWHAGVDQRQPWILWSSGIVLGVAIYALFMYFEKRRQNVLNLVENLKKWD